MLIYILFMIFLGIPVMVTEFFIGRYSRSNTVGSFKKMAPGTKWCWIGYNGILAAFLILGFYAVVSGWTLEYVWQTVNGSLYSTPGVDFTAGFDNFSSNALRPIFWTAVFIGLTHFVIASGVEKGIERASKIMMPLLFFILVVMCVRSVTLPNAEAGLVYLFKPDFSKLSMMTVLAALGQLFFSMSLAMGIMITYGSYLRKQDQIEQSVRQIEVFDTLVAFLAGLMIVPAVFVYSGGDESALGKGPSLMFVTLPKVFAEMKIGNLVGAGFFILVLFAALTSSVSVMEAIVSGLDDRYHWGRKKATVICYIYAVALGICCSLGFGKWSSFTIFGFSILDFLDFVSNSLLMPVVGMLTCIMVGFVLKPQLIVNEIELNGPFKMKKFYSAMVKWIAPPCLLAILISSILDTLGIVKL